jgi:transposase-like protein
MTELPSTNTRRWVARRKAAVVAAVSSGMLTVEEACRRYQMSEEELRAWQCAFETYGIVGLRAGYIRNTVALTPKHRRPSNEADAARRAWGARSTGTAPEATRSSRKRRSVL